MSTLNDHYREYEWATDEEWYSQVKVEDDEREWYYAAKMMRKGVLVARLEGEDYRGPIKKLVPFDKLTFLK